MLAAGLIASACAALFLPGGPLFDSVALRLLFSASAAFIGVAALRLTILTSRMWHDKTSRLARARRRSSASPCWGSHTLALFWVPIAWRSSDGGIERLAQRVRDPGYQCRRR